MLLFLQSLDVKTVVGKFPLLMNNIAKTPGTSQSIVTDQGAPNLVPTDMNGRPFAAFAASLLGVPVAAVLFARNVYNLTCMCLSSSMGWPTSPP